MTDETWRRLIAAGWLALWSVGVWWRMVVG